MMRHFWRIVLFTVLLAGGLGALCSTGGGFHPPPVLAEALKTTEEPLDPTCNALGKLQVNVYPAEREEFSDENGGTIKACRYDVELVNTDDTYSIMVFTNGSGSVDRGEEIFHTRHGHKALDPGEAYPRQQYLIVYPDGSEESFFYTYLKATFNDPDFPKDCRPTVDHLYTWDLPYRLVEAPCLDLSTNPPEIVEWTPPEGLVSEPSGAQTAGEAGEESGSESSRPQSEDEQLAQQGGDLMNQFIELLVLGDLDNLEQWEGWNGLNDIQRANLLAIIERLGERATEYLSPGQQVELDKVDRQEALDLQKEEQLAQRLLEQGRAWERLDMLLNRERLRDKNDLLVWIYDNYRAAQPLVGAANWLASWADEMANLEDWAKNEAVKFLQENSGESVEDAAVIILQGVADIANAPAKAHYAFYLQKYNQYRQQNLDHEEAHEQAMQDLRTVPDKLNEGNLKLNNSRIWGVVFENSAVEGGLYDRAFNELKGGYDPGVTP